MTKERLRNYYTLKCEAAQLREKIIELESLAASPSSPSLSGMPSGGHSGGSALENAVVRIADLRQLYIKKLGDLVTEQSVVEFAISGLDPTERQLMRARYLDGMKWEEVCVAIGYSWQQTHRIHARALSKLADK